MFWLVLDNIVLNGPLGNLFVFKGSVPKDALKAHAFSNIEREGVMVTPI